MTASVVMSHSQPNFIADRMTNKNAGVEETNGKTRTSPQVIAMITLHFLAVECDSINIL